VWSFRADFWEFLADYIGNFCPLIINFKVAKSSRFKESINEKWQAFTNYSGKKVADN
jgi:hypothetical protein